VELLRFATVSEMPPPLEIDPTVKLAGGTPANGRF